MSQIKSQSIIISFFGGFLVAMGLAALFIWLDVGWRNGPIGMALPIVLGTLTMLWLRGNLKGSNSELP